MIIVWSCGTDEGFLNNCGKDFRFLSVLCDFSSKNFSSDQRVPFTFINVFSLKKKRFPSLNSFFGTMNFPEEESFSKKNSKKVGKNAFRVLWVSLRVFSGSVNLMKIFNSSVPLHIKKLVFLNLEQGANLGRSRLVFNTAPSKKSIKSNEKSKLICMKCCLYRQRIKKATT